MKKYIKPMMEAIEIKTEGMLCTSSERDEGTFDEGYGIPL